MEIKILQYVLGVNIEHALKLSFPFTNLTLFTGQYSWS
jgi:hypothetical protein